MIGYYILRGFHHGWPVLVSTSPSWCVFVPPKYRKYSVMPSLVTLISYHLTDRVCILSIVENYFYPDMCPDPYVPVSRLDMIMTFWFTLATIGLCLEFLNPLGTNIFHLIILLAFNILNDFSTEV